jgi:hypothetical protein
MNFLIVALILSMISSPCGPIALHLNVSIPAVVLYTLDCQSIVVAMETHHIHSLLNHTNVINEEPNFSFNDVYRSIPANSAQFVLDFGAGNWFTIGPGGDADLLKLMQHCCSPTSVLFTTFAGIFNHWLRLLTSSGSHPAIGEFIDTGKRLLSGERIYQYPIGAALHERDDENQRECESNSVCGKPTNYSL